MAPKRTKAPENLPPNTPTNAIDTFLRLQFDDFQRSASKASTFAINLAKEITGGRFDCEDNELASIRESLELILDIALSATKSEEQSSKSVIALMVALCSQPAATNINDLIPDLSFLLYRAILRLECKDDTIRSRSMTLVSTVMERMGEVADDGVIEDETFNLVNEALLPRLSDKSIAVRNAAIKASALLQDPGDSPSGNSEDTLTNQLMYLCTHDSSPVCRSSAVNSIVVTRYTLPTIICRIRDTSSTVRIAALNVLKNQVDVRLMTDQERVVALRSGLTPRCESTYLAASKMLCCGWLKSLGYSVLNLLKLLDVANSENVCELATTAILSAPHNSTLKDLSNNERAAYNAALENSIPVGLLSIQSSLLLRVKIDKIKADVRIPENHKQELVDELMPDTPVICSSIQKHLNNFIQNTLNDSSDEDSADGDDESFICMQLLKMARHADWSDESGRRQLLELLHGMLCSSNTPDELVEPCIRALASAHKSESEYVERINEIISILGDYDAEDENMDAAEAAFRQLRIVSIVGVVLEYTTRSLSDDFIAQFSDQILPAIISQEEMIREAGVCALGKYSLLGQNAALEYRPLLLGIAANKKEGKEIRAQALLAMSDLAMLWDGMTDEVDCMDLMTEEMMRVSLPSLLLDILDNESPGLVVVAGEICSKLIMMGRVQDTEILAKLLVIYFDPLFNAFSSSAPAEEDEEGGRITAKSVANACKKQLSSDTEDATIVGSPIRLQQILSLFFNTISAVTGGKSPIMGHATKDVLRLVTGGWKAGGGRQDSKKKLKAADKVALDKVLTFMGNVGNVHGRVAVEIATFLEDSTEHSIESNTLRDCVNALSKMQIDNKADAVDLREMVLGIEDLLDVCGANKTVMKNWTKFVENVDEGRKLKDVGENRSQGKVKSFGVEEAEAEREVLGEVQVA